MSTKVVSKPTGASTQEHRLLEVRDLKTHFLSPRGRVRAVDGVSFSLERGRTLGVVGESGSGKTILSRSIMGLLPSHNVVREGTVLYDGTDISDFDAKAMRSVWGSEMAMVFQDPMTSLNPVVKVGRQITESLRFHLQMDKQEAGRTIGVPATGWTTRRPPRTSSS